MGVCDTRQMYYEGAEDDPTSITEAWLAAQICDNVNIKHQFCWVDGDYVHFIVHIDEGSGLLLGATPQLTRRILIDDLNAILRSNALEELYSESE